MKKPSFQARSELTQNPTARKLFTIMAEKQTNLALSADVTTAAELIRLANTVGPEICVLKTHIDIIDDFTPALIEKLKILADKHHFLLFEDRKFADIGNTVQHQYRDGIYHIVDWADMVNAHLLPGEGVINGLEVVGQAKGRGLLLIAEMSSKPNFFTAEYTKTTVAMAEKHHDFVIGFICQQKLTADPRFIHMTPGVNLATTNDQLGQNYLTPETAIQLGTDIIIVGRGIYAAENPTTVAKEYRQQAWQAYLAKT